MTLVKANHPCLKVRRWETKWSVPWFDCDESLTCHGLNSNLGHFGSFTFIFVSCGESRLIVSWCASGRCGMVGSDKDRGKSMRPDAEDRGWSTTDRVLDGQTIERSGDTVCSLHRACGDEERRFVGWGSKSRLTVCQWFCLKTTGTVSPDLASKPVALCFPIWASKPVAMVWWFEPQNYHDGFLVWASKPCGLRFVDCITKPTGEWRWRGARAEI
jgi:hypothetical protein